MKSLQIEDVASQASGHSKDSRFGIDAQLYVEAIKKMQVGLYIWRMDDLNDVNSLVLIEANPAASEFTGVPASDVVGKRLTETFPALADTEIPEIYANVVRSQQPCDLGEIPYEDDRVAKSFFRVKAFPLSDRCVGVAFENVTTQKEEQAIRQEQAAQLKILFDHSAAGMARLSPEGQWIQVNQQLCDLLGYSMAELLEKSFRDVTHPEDHTIDSTIYEQLISGQKSQVSFEKRYLTKQETVVWASVTVSTFRNADGELAYFIATIQDITDRKEARVALEQQKNDLVAINMMLTNTMTALEQRNQELDQFAYVTSHDLKAPLRAIANLTTWIEEDLGSKLPPENAEQFELLKSRVHRMEGLIDGLLEYSRVGRTHQSHEQVDVAQLLKHVVDSLSPLKDFKIEILPPMPTLQAKKVPLTQIFLNLISNAIKHHPRADGRVQISARELPDFYEFEIADDGPGIDPSYHEKIFTIFQVLQPRDTLESTGIGLSIVQKAVTAEGGEISLESALGEGATFRFTWPKSPRVGL